MIDVWRYGVAGIVNNAVDPLGRYPEVIVRVDGQTSEATVSVIDDGEEIFISSQRLLGSRGTRGRR